MKKVLIILVILTAPFLAAAQDTTSTVTEETITITAPVKEEVKTEVSTQNSTAATSRAKAKDMNYKKSNDIISVKAYRKSLQIKIKEVKLC